jgi:plastocyanin
MRRVLVVVGLVAGALFLVSPARAGGGCHGGGVASGAGTTVELAMNCMNPRVVRLDGDSAVVTFTNRDQVAHNVWGDRWGIDELRPGESETHLFGEGTNVYACSLHPGMVGAVVVGDGVGAAVAPVAKMTAKPAADIASPAAWLLAGVAGAALGAAFTTGARRLRTR